MGYFSKVRYAHIIRVAQKTESFFVSSDAKNRVLFNGNNVVLTCNDPKDYQKPDPQLQEVVTAFGDAFRKASALHDH